MPRSYQIFGEAMVSVRFGFHVPYDNNPDPMQSDPNIWELGLTSEPIIVTPNFYHKDIMIDSFGPNVPADVLSQIADAIIEFKLVHYDIDPLAYYQRESFGGGNAGFQDTNQAADMNFAGVPLGGGLPLYASGNHLVGLGFSNGNDESALRFPATYLVEPPVRYNIGTKRTIFECRARAIPYAPLQVESIKASGGSFFAYNVPLFGNTLFDGLLLDETDP